MEFLYQLFLNNLDIYFLISFMVFLSFIDEFKIYDIIISIIIGLLWPIILTNVLIRFFRIR